MQRQTATAGYLLYCIYRPTRHNLVKGLIGIQDQPVETIAAKGLCAAVSAVTRQMSIPDIATLKCYEQVVATCHQPQAVIPMRYGAIFNNKSEVAAHLEEQSTIYKSLLLRFMDCDEMGIRLMLTDPVHQRMGDRKSITQNNDKMQILTPLSGPGKTYLMLQKERYGLEDTFLHRAERLIRQWQTFFKSLYVQCRWERPQAAAAHQVPILSIYFLIRRRHIADFRKLFIHISQQRTEKAMLSGPWPPYNFVQQYQKAFRMESPGQIGRFEGEYR